MNEWGGLPPRGFCPLGTRVHLFLGAPRGGWANLKQGPSGCASSACTLCPTPAACEKIGADVSAGILRVGQLQGMCLVE